MKKGCDAGASHTPSTEETWDLDFT
ncbi:hypothetical protein HYPGJ_30734 [Hyphomicrobium sp. GJ21]|nr:hypothetical protein HYPGJ_30734 [Hyphomicrobium sp. GJ21]